MFIVSSCLILARHNLQVLVGTELDRLVQQILSVSTTIPYHDGTLMLFTRQGSACFFPFWCHVVLEVASHTIEKQVIEEINEALDLANDESECTLDSSARPKTTFKGYDFIAIYLFYIISVLWSKHGTCFGWFDQS